jgi:hypothetical protein
MALSQKQFFFVKFDPSLMIAIFIFAAILIHTGCGGAAPVQPLQKLVLPLSLDLVQQAAQWAHK